MSGGASGKVVCVTGASGYVASWLVKVLLERGYTVKATVRNLSQASLKTYLEELFEQDLQSNKKRKINIMNMRKKLYIFLLDAEVIEPAVKGTLNVLRSCSKVPSVRRVVVTSSIVSVLCNRSAKGPDVLVDETWFADAVFCEEAKLWYPLSKTLAEEAAWKFADIDLVTLHPGFVLGPLLQPTLNFSSEVFLDIIKGKDVFPSYEFVDIRDVAYAHIMSFENPSASGRYCLVGTTISHSETQQILHKLYPSISFPIIATENTTYQISKKKAESLGINFMPLEVSLKDTVENLKENNFLSL
ncbi:hypothetical protein Pfo_020820 [Paulownia fortunei]|nr:hypothetical protein Pfo_020820 [Paulownia fortunei]